MSEDEQHRVAVRLEIPAGLSQLLMHWKPLSPLEIESVTGLHRIKTVMKNHLVVTHVLSRIDNDNQYRIVKRSRDKKELMLVAAEYELLGDGS